MPVRAMLTPPRLPQRSEMRRDGAFTSATGDLYLTAIQFSALSRHS
jgi:hypothetical protein